MQRIVNVSNRLPFPGANSAPGGLASGVLAAMHAQRGLWLGWDGELHPDDPERLAITVQNDIAFARISYRSEEQRAYQAVSKSIVAMRIVAGHPRYRLLEMVRAYAALRLAESGDSAAIAARHARYFAQRCVEAEAPDSAAVDPRDLGNIRSALEWSFSEQGDAAIARDLSIAATPILLRWSLLAECRRWSARALEVLYDADRGSIFESRLIRTLAISTMFTIGNDERLRGQMARGLDLARSLGDQRGQFEFLTGMHRSDIGCRERSNARRL